MYLFIETICAHNGEIFLLSNHVERMNLSSKQFNHGKIFSEDDILKAVIIPLEFSAALCRIRLTYSDVIHSVEYFSYSPKPIYSFKLVHDDTIDYSFKFADRSNLENLLSQKQSADEIIIVKNGEITDTSYSNIALFNGMEFHTPKNPLLKGVKRKDLLEKGIISEKVIKSNEILNYKSIHLINAMLNLGDIEIEIKPNQTIIL